MEDPEVVLAAAARFLEARQRSEDEVRRRLLAAGYRSRLVDEAVARLVGLGYLDDEEFARAWVGARDRARPRGQRALRVELRRKGVAPDLIDQVLMERDQRTASGRRPDGDPTPAGTGSVSEPGEDPRDAGGPPADLVAARRLLARRGNTLGRVEDPRRRRQRAYALLARNGFDPETIRVALEDVHGDGGTDDPEDPRADGPV